MMALNRLVRYVLVFALTILVSGGARADDSLRVVVMGDSLISGYGLLPEESYASKLNARLQAVGYKNLEVINMCEDGLTAAVAWDRLANLLSKHPDVVVLELGGNDARRGIVVDQIFRNLMGVIEELSKRRIYVVLMGSKAPEEKGYMYVKQFEMMYQQVVEKYKVALYPDVLDGIAGNTQLTLADGYRPNAKGMDVIVENTYRYVDSGLRWRMSVNEYQQKYQQQADPGRGGALPVDPPPLPAR